MNNNVPVLAECKVKKLTEENVGFVLTATYLVSRKIVTGEYDRPSTIHYFYNANSASNGYPEYFGLWGFAALNMRMWKAKVGTLLRMTFQGKGEPDDEGKTPWLCDIDMLKNDTINVEVFQRLKDEVLEFRQYIASRSNMIADVDASSSADSEELPF